VGTFLRHSVFSKANDAALRDFVLHARTRAYGLDAIVNKSVGAMCSEAFG